MVSAGIAGIASNLSAGWLIDRFGVDLLLFYLWHWRAYVG